ncbi:MAG TPA: hypothetical protein VH816_16195 [Gaiellaceae bacterium]
MNATLEGGDLMSYRKRFVAMYLALAAFAGALLAAAVALAIVPGTRSASERRPSLVHPAAKAVPSAPRLATGRALSGFAASFQDYATTAQAGVGGPKLIVRDCVEGGDGRAFCAYTVQGVCHGAMLTEQPIAVEQAGNVGLPAPDCTARRALKWIGANG